MSSKLFSITTSFLIIIIIGFILRKLKVFKREDSSTINQIILYFTLPALIFSAVVEAEIKFKLLGLSLLAVILVLLLIGISFLLGKLMRLKSTVLGGFILAAAVSNTAFLGYPVIVAALGKAKLINAVFYDYAIGIVIFTLGIYISQHYGKGKNKLGIFEVLKFPALLVIFPAIALKGVNLPEFFLDAIDSIGKATAPLVLLSIGLNIRKIKISKYFLPLCLLLIIKLFIAPIVGVYIGRILQFSDDMMKVAFIQSAMPSAMMSVVLGLKYELDTDFLIPAVIVSTIVSMVTLPLLSIYLF